MIELLRLILTGTLYRIDIIKNSGIKSYSRTDGKTPVHGRTVKHSIIQKSFFGITEESLEL